VTHLDSNDAPLGTVATLTSASQFKLGTPENPPNEADCAIAELHTATSPNLTMPKGVPQFQGTAAAQPSDAVLQVRSPSSSGIVLTVDTTLEVAFDFGTYFFCKQLLVQTQDGGPEFAVPGDSGSLVIRKRPAGNDAVGLIFATGLQKQDPSTGRLLTFSAVCPIDNILASFSNLASA
jgi:hypothetical protein